MTYDIYFHNDFDGRASAAVMLAFLRGRGDDIEHFTPVNYHLLDQWRDDRFFKKHKLFKGERNPAIVVDFLYHPEAAFWFEHHPTTFKRDDWKKNFRPDKYHHLKPEYPSCCHLVYAALKKDFRWKPSKNITELVKWLDVIDGAGYKSAKQTIELKEAALRVNEFIERKDHDAKENKQIIELLANGSLDAIAKQPEVKKTLKKIAIEDKKALVFAKKYAVIMGGVCFLDRTITKLDFPHFALPYLFPKQLYYVRISARNGMYHLNIGLNPWKKDDGTINIGDLLKKFGGGGHERVGGVEFTSHKKTLEATKQCIGAINNSINNAR